jgi:predicted membrane channel-forming protein YqfA (hemolysin III family)
MSPHYRKLIGAIAMLAFVLVYALVAMALADSRPMHDAPEYVQTILYIVLGLVWILPVMPLVKWMERSGRRPTPR